MSAAMEATAGNSIASTQTCSGSSEPEPEEPPEPPETRPSLVVPRVHQYVHASIGTTSTTTTTTAVITSGGSSGTAHKGLMASETATTTSSSTTDALSSTPIIVASYDHSQLMRSTTASLPPVTTTAASSIDEEKTPRFIAVSEHPTSATTHTTDFAGPTPASAPREREERKEEVEERKESTDGMGSLAMLSRKEEKKSIVMLVTAMLDETHTPERRMAFNLGKPEMCTDLQNTLTRLGHSCRVEMVSHANMDEILRGIKVYETVFNICDGTDVDGAVGVSLVHKLEALKIPFAGACSLFYTISSSKSLMKAQFERFETPTMPYRLVESDEKPEEALALGPASLSGRLTPLKHWPLFVKPDDAYGSMGISDACVCRDQGQLMAQCHSLRKQGFQRLMVEGFLDGDEFSVLMTDAMTYPAVRKVYLREGALCLDFKADWIDNAYEMAPVKDAELDARLRAVAMHAYKAVHGNSYARADLRIHSATGEICVLEVNSQPGIGDNSTAWDILRGQAEVTARPHQVIAAEFLHQIVTHPRRGQRALMRTISDSSDDSASAAGSDDDLPFDASSSESHATSSASSSSSLSLLSPSPVVTPVRAPSSPKESRSSATLMLLTPARSPAMMATTPYCRSPSPSSLMRASDSDADSPTPDPE